MNHRLLNVLTKAHVPKAPTLSAMVGRTSCQQKIRPPGLFKMEGWPIPIHNPYREATRRGTPGATQGTGTDQALCNTDKKGNPSWGRAFLVGQPQKKRGKRIGATEQLSKDLADSL